MSRKIIKQTVLLLLAVMFISLGIASLQPQYGPVAWGAVLFIPLVILTLVIYDSLAADKKKAFAIFVLLLLLGGIYFEFAHSI